MQKRGIAAQVVGVLLVVLASATIAASASAEPAPPPDGPSPVPCKSAGGGHYDCSFYPAGNGISAGAPVQSSSGTRVGYLNHGTNWVICQSQGAVVHSGAYYNDWWAYTEANDSNYGWVNAVYANGGDNNGQFEGVPSCGSAHGSPPSKSTSPPTHQPTREGPHNMVALGDSYSSGEGTKPTKPGSCQRTKYAYPHLVARYLGFHLKFVACSGYKSKQILQSEVPRIRSSADLVTLTAGGDDAGFADVLTKCVPSVVFGPFASGPWCKKVVANEVKVLRNKLPGRLDTLYGAIRSRAPHAKVVVLGYPYLFSGLCKIPKSLRSLQPAEDFMDATIKAAAHRHGFTYVDSRKGFSGHSTCDRVVWINNLWPGWRATDYIRHPSEYKDVYLKTLAYHPNVPGHKEFARLVERALR